MATQVLEIRNWHPATLNQLLKSRYRSASLKRADRNRIWIMAGVQGVTEAKAKRRVTLEVTMAKGMRTPDVDAYWKSLLDALVKAKLLVSDHSKWLEIAPLVVVRGKTTEIMTRITLEDL